MTHPIFDGNAIRERINNVMYDHLTELPQDTHQWSKQQYESFVDELTFVGLLCMAEDEMKKFKQKEMGCNDGVDDDGLQVPF